MRRRLCGVQPLYLILYRLRAAGGLCEWLADGSMVVSAKAAKEVWNFFGIGDRFGYSIVEGHGHCQLPERQFPEVQAFIDKFLLGKETNTKDIQVVSGIK